MKQVSPTNYKDLLLITLMMFALAWLTISLPFVNAAQLQMKFAQETSKENSKSTDDNNNPLSNTIEEKSESGPVSISEYLHDQHSQVELQATLINYYKCHPSDLYYAFHPDLLSPPPKA
jgi:hypothetical protein